MRALRRLTSVHCSIHVAALPDEIKIAAGIPLEATHFCYAYPLDCLAGDFERLVAENAANPRTWLEALLIGAYCYFDEKGDMIRINSLALTPCANGRGTRPQTTTHPIASLHTCLCLSPHACVCSQEQRCAAP